MRSPRTFHRSYDDWKLSTPWDDEPEPCECGEDNCTCAEDAALDYGDWLYQRQKDDEATR